LYTFRDLLEGLVDLLLCFAGRHGCCSHEQITPGRKGIFGDLGGYGKVIGGLEAAVPVGKE
jgi:hypothetical protein